jgi:diadenosine tetraphosphate (Ap4A) HIT family hydrolase
MFTLHPRLEADCIVMGDFPLSRLLLMNDSRYPWFILVPRRVDIHEIYQLNEKEQQQLQRESVALGQCIMDAFGGDKLNVAALGNLVPQLHIHHIVRYLDDAAWPNPVWGVGISLPYSEEQVAGIRERIGHICSFDLKPA